jgi:lysophospholipase L1-like esterase
VDVVADAKTRAIVAFGDSVTDGAESTPNANHRWPDRLAARLADAHLPLAVVNAGISGNRVTGELRGDSMVSRLERDVLSQPGARYVVFLGGINDFLDDRVDVSADAIIAADRDIVARCHARGLRVYGATLLPTEGNDEFYTPKIEAKRVALNDWIRHGGAFDAVIDLEAALADPAKPTRLRPDFASEDHVHPNDAGYAALAAAVPLALFDEAAPR